MYAILRSGGKQYRVQAGDRIRVEKLEGTLGSEVTLTDILLVGGESTHVGAPIVKDAKITAVVTRQELGPKVIIFKKKRRQGYRRFKGHRQPYTELFIKAIAGPGGTSSKSDEKPPVMDFAAIRAERAEEKAKERQAAREEAKASPEGEAPAKRAVAKKKVAKKAAPKKKVAKKSGKKGGAKKKTAKKTSKKA
ncbi:MAG: 50S ribosomal protein L21 [Pseudobdellovibrionaceae bacterium]